MWVRLRYFSCALLLSLCALGITGCTIEDAERNTLSAQKFAVKYGHLAPAGYRWIPAGISGICTLALGILGLVRERRKGMKMKDAILTKSDQIDKLILSAGMNKENPGNVVTTFMKNDTRSRSPKEKSCLNHFDQIRKS